MYDPLGINTASYDPLGIKQAQSEQTFSEDYYIQSANEAKRTDARFFPTVAGLAGSVVLAPFAGLGGATELLTSGGDLNKAQKVMEDISSPATAYLSDEERAVAGGASEVLMTPFTLAGKGLEYGVKQTPLKGTIAEPIARTAGEFGLMMLVPAMEGIKTVAERPFRSMERVLEPTKEIRTPKYDPLDIQAKYDPLNIKEVTKADTEVATSQPEQTPASIAKSIEAKAREIGIAMDDFDSLAGFDPTTIKKQAEMAAKVMTDIDTARSMVRGEEPLPDGLRGISLVKAMEERIKADRDVELAYELANSPLASEVSLAAQELSLTRGRELDSFSAKVADIKKARVERAGKDAVKKTTEVKKSLKTETKKLNLSKEELSWDRFLKIIEC